MSEGCTHVGTKEMGNLIAERDPVDTTIQDKGKRNRYEK